LFVPHHLTHALFLRLCTTGSLLQRSHLSGHVIMYSRVHVRGESSDAIERSRLPARSRVYRGSVLCRRAHAQY
jgi:hypothetical protein